MRKPINFWTERDKRHGELYRLAQAQTMLDLFEKRAAALQRRRRSLGSSSSRNGVSGVSLLDLFDRRRRQSQKAARKARAEAKRKGDNRP